MVRGSKVGHLWIQDCDECDSHVRWHYHRLNPNGQAVKEVEMTIVRALKIIAAFDELGKDEDWQDVPDATYRNIGMKRYEYPRLLEEMWKRYKTRRLHQEVLDLAANLVMDDLTKARKKEISDGLKSIRQELNSRRKR